MKSPRDRYYTDNNFHVLVDNMVGYIRNCHYTPSEMREAAILASIIYTEQNPQENPFPKEVLDWLDRIDKL